MSNAAHTHGPWTAGDDGGIWATHEDGEPFEVASADRFADVRLIAEAPAMLAALRWAKDAMTPANNSEEIEVCSEIDAILARIEGAGA